MARKIYERFSYEGLQSFTNGFSEENFIGKFQFGKVYRGQIQRGSSTKYVTVKLWEPQDRFPDRVSHNHNRLMDELFLLQHPRMVSHPNIVDLVGYCCEDFLRLGVVYDLHSLDTVENLIPKGSFSWSHRIKVAYDFACLLKFLHTGSHRSCPILVRNIQPDHIMVDQSYTTKLFDFSMICGGILPDWTLVRMPFICGNFSFLDPKSGSLGTWLIQSDVFSYGVLLLSLISKRVYTDPEEIDWDSLIHLWAESEFRKRVPMLLVNGRSEIFENDSYFSLSNALRLDYDRSKFSLVDKTLEDDPTFSRNDGSKITELALQCVQNVFVWRPLMKQVIKCFRSLDVVKQLGF